jgi:hypothetical protein
MRLTGQPRENGAVRRSSAPLEFAEGGPHPCGSHDAQRCRFEETWKFSAAWSVSRSESQLTYMAAVVLAAQFVLDGGVR